MYTCNRQGELLQAEIGADAYHEVISIQNKGVKEVFESILKVVIDKNPLNQHLQPVKVVKPKRNSWITGLFGSSSSADVS